MRVPGCGKWCTKLVHRKRHPVLPWGVALHSGGNLYPRPGHCQLSSGVGMSVLVYRGVLSVPWRRLNHRGRFRGYRPVALRGRSDGGWQLQCPGPIYGGPGGHECTFPPTAQAVVDVFRKIVWQKKVFFGFVPNIYIFLFGPFTNIPTLCRNNLLYKT